MFTLTYGNEITSPCVLATALCFCVTQELELLIHLWCPRKRRLMAARRITVILLPAGTEWSRMETQEGGRALHGDPTGTAPGWCATGEWGPPALRRVPYRALPQGCSEGSCLQRALAHGFLLDVIFVVGKIFLLLAWVVLWICLTAVLRLWQSRPKIWQSERKC